MPGTVLSQRAEHLIPSEVRLMFRHGNWTKRTTGLCIGYVNANIVSVPLDIAFDFLLFCQRNPKACPVLEVLDPGDPVVKSLALGADVRTDLPRYRVFAHGELLDEPDDVLNYWRDDLVTFLFGCSDTFEGPLEQAGIHPRWRQGDDTGDSVFVSNIQTLPAGLFHGPLVVSMRPIPNHQVSLAVQVTSRFPSHHGAPIHIGNPSKIGISDISKSEWVNGVLPVPEEVPVFWACGVTPQMAAIKSMPELMITHYPSHMFISDIPSEQHSIL